jgi:hypothetical protein
MNRKKYRSSILLCIIGFFISVQVCGRDNFHDQLFEMENFHDQALRTDNFSAKMIVGGPRIQYDSRYLLLQFTSELDRYSLPGSIDLRDSANSLLPNCTIEMFPGDNTGKTVWIRFSDNFSLEESSKYYVDIQKSLRYVKNVTRNGVKKYVKVPKKMTYYFVTSSRCPLIPTIEAGGVGQRTKYVVVSDIHIGDARATDNGYNWFSENVTEFKSFLDDVSGNTQIKELIIDGDLFDEWEMPVDVKPFVGAVTTSDEFFQSVANAPTMKPIIDKLNQIADSGLIKLVYIPGNHDMLMTETAMKKIFPNAVWAGTNSAGGGISGTGLYSPEPGISIEHGHIYDFYNAPDPFTQTGSHLPPGYFVSRMYSTKAISGKQLLSVQGDFWGDAFFYGSWEVVLYQIFGTFKPDIPAIITGIDGYSNPYTYAQARDLYFNADIAGKWNQRQAMNGVYSPEDEVSALLAGAGVWIWGNLEVAAQQQYFVPKRAEIVVFGHTHMALLKGYNKYNKEILSATESLPAFDQLGPATKIYDNSGTWANKSQTPKGYSNRTYVVISPAQTVSGLDTVSVYRYDPDADGQNMADNLLLDEKNIHLSTGSTQTAMPLIR